MMLPESTLAKMLAGGARALAGYALGDPTLLDTESTAPSARSQFGGWHNVLTARIEDLAVAVAADRPDFFAEQVRWTRAALEVRGIPPAVLRTRLEALRRVLSEEIPLERLPPAMECLDRALADFDGEPAGMTPRLSADTPEQRLAAAYLLAILEGDRRRASGLILAAADEGKSAADLYLHVLQPAEEELGRMWHLGEINVAEEHFATATTRWVMAQLHGRVEPKPANGKTLLAAGVASNQHDLGIQAVADLFEQDGWRVVLLGASVPVEDLVEAVDFYSPDAVALSISLVGQLPTLQNTIAAIRATPQGATTKILVGGRGMMNDPQLVKWLGADVFAANALDAVGCGNALVGLSAASS
ncbi:MAG: cobalamin-dependent protein [Pirellulales bacterium]|nr:cobalamin-dependent protein [Pirellulales bacterium]